MLYNKVYTMKKVFFVLILLAAGTATHAQFTHYGVRAGLGASYVGDDLLTTAPVIGANLGAFINYGFTTSKTAFADNLYLQTGLFLIRRGTYFKQELAAMNSIRTGFYHTYYAQVPLLAAWRWELPLRVADQYVNFYFGPAFNVGLFGRIWDRRVTPGYPQSTMNYDTYITGTKEDRAAFKHLRRLDVSSILGVGYQHGSFLFDLYWDHGFVALRKEEDVLNNLEGQIWNQEHATKEGNANPAVPTEKPKKRNSYTGTNNSVIFTVSYLLPVQGR